MNNVTILYGGQKLVARKIRYFKYNDINYFIYCLNEIDSDGYTKLYIVKLKNNIEQVIDDNDWDSIKNIIHTVVKEIKTNNIESFVDIDSNEIKEIDSNYSRPFKLKKTLVDTIAYEEMDNEINSKEKILERLEEFLKNPIMDEPEEDLSAPIKPTSEIIKKIDKEPIQNQNEDLDSIMKELSENKRYCEELKIENQKLQKDVINYKEKIEYIKGIIRDL